MNISARLFQFISVLENFVVRASTKSLNLNTLNNSKKHFTSIIIVTFNSPEYITKCLNSLKRYPINGEVIVVDNGSSLETKNLLKKYLRRGVITKLYFLAENRYFVGGNNYGLSKISNKSDSILLLNSDTEVLHHNWLNYLISTFSTYDISSYGYASLPFRPDGWCFLMKRSVLDAIGLLNAKYKMNGGITEFTAIALKKGFKVVSVLNYQDKIVHHVGKSYTNLNSTTTKFPYISTASALKMFWGSKVEPIDVKLVD